MEMEEYEYKGHEIRVSCKERGSRGDIYWRVNIKKDGEPKKYEPGLKPFDTYELAVAEGKTWAEKWIDAREEFK